MWLEPSLVLMSRFGFPLVLRAWASLALMAFICTIADSVARHISRHLVRVSLGSCRSLFLTPLSRIPQTILSRINLSVNVAKWHVCASARRAVVYPSIDSPVSVVETVPFVDYIGFTIFLHQSSITLLILSLSSFSNGKAL